MDIAVLIVISITLAVLGVSLYLQHRKSRVKVYFPGGTTEIRYKAKEEAEIAIHFKNVSRITIIGMDVCVYVPLTFSPKKLEYLGTFTNKVTPTTPGEVFRDMQYMFTGKQFVLVYREEAKVGLIMQMPERTGHYPISVHIISDQGELGTHNLNIIVY